MMRASPKAEVLAAPLEGETVLLHLGSKRYFRLNRTAAFVWRGLEQGHDARSIAQALAAEFDVSEHDAEAAVTELISALAREELVAGAPDESQ
jgi:hypothetical protein